MPQASAPIPARGSRRNFLSNVFRISTAAAISATAPALASPKQGYVTEGFLVPTDMAPRFDEARQLVSDFEDHAIHPAILSDGSFGFHGKNGFGPEPIELWQRFRSCERAIFIEYLRVSGRVA